MILDRLKRKFNEYVEEDKQHEHPSPGGKGPSLAGKIMTKAGNLLKFDQVADIVKQSAQLAHIKNPQSHFEKLDEQILEVLIEENRQMKEILEKNNTEMEELRERAETLKSLEEEASEENEMLKFKVLSLESQAQMEGKDLSNISFVDEMRHSKKALQKEVDKLQKEVKALAMMNEQDLSADTTATDPKVALDYLRLLYELHKVEFSDNDQAKIMVSLLMKDQRLYKFYRERLFQQVAKKAIESAELLYKTSNTHSQAGNSNNLDQQTKVFVENKKLKRENDGLKTKINQHMEQIKQLEDSVRNAERKGQQKMVQMKQQVNKIGSKFAALKSEFAFVKGDTQEQQDYLQSYMQPNMQLLNNKIHQYTTSNSQQLAQARKAVYDKNKEISDIFMKYTTLQQKTADNQQNSKLIYEKNKQIGDLFTQNKQLQEEIEEQREISQNAMQQIEMLRDKIRQTESGQSQQVKDLQQKNQQLDHELKEMKHNEVVKSLMKPDVSKEVEEARKAVMEKNKMISNMTNKQFELIRTIEEQNDEIDQLRQQLNTRPVSSSSGGSGSQNQQVKELQQRNQQLMNEIEKLKNEAKEAKHVEVVKSLMKQDVSKEVEDARKAVIEKNKLISDMNNQKFELLRQIEDKDEEIQKLKQQINPSKQANTSKQQTYNEHERDQVSFQKSKQGVEESEEQDFFGGFLTSIGKSIFGSTAAAPPTQQKQEPIRTYTTQKEEHQNSPLARLTSPPTKKDQYIFGVNSTEKQQQKQQKPSKSDSPTFTRNDHDPKLLLHMIPDKDDILEKVREQSEILNTDSPQRILELQKRDTPTKHSFSNSMRNSVDNSKASHESNMFTFKNQTESLTKAKTTSQIKQSPSVFESNNEDDFFGSFQPLKAGQKKQEEVKKKEEEVVAPPIPEVNLDFLNDMFGNLLGKTSSPDKNKESTTGDAPFIHDKVGWADTDLDLDLDNPAAEQEPVFEEVPEVKQIEPEEELDIPDILENNSESPRFTKESPQQEQNQAQLGGWQDEEDIFIDDNQLQNEKSGSPFKLKAQASGKMQLQDSELQNAESELVLQEKDNEAGWNADEDLLIEDEIMTAQPEKQEEEVKYDKQEHGIQRMFTFSDMNKDLLESSEMLGQRSKTEQVILPVIQEEEKTGWQADDEIQVDDNLSQTSNTSGQFNDVEDPQKEDIEDIITESDQQEQQQEEIKANIEESGWGATDEFNLDNQLLEEVAPNIKEEEKKKGEHKAMGDDIQRVFTFSEIDKNLFESMDKLGQKMKSEQVLLPVIQEEEKVGWQADDVELPFDELEIAPHMQHLAVSQQHDDVNRVFTFSELQLPDQLSQFKILAQSNQDFDSIPYEQNFSESNKQQHAPGSGWGTGTLDIIEDEELLAEQEETDEIQQRHFIQEQASQQLEEQQLIEEEKQTESPQREGTHETNQQELFEKQEIQVDEQQDYGYESDEEELATSPHPEAQEDQLKGSGKDDDDQQSQPPLSEPAQQHETIDKQDLAVEHMDSDSQEPHQQQEEQFSPQSQRLPEIQHLQEHKEPQFSIMTQHMTETPYQQTTTEMNFGWDNDGPEVDVEIQQPTQFDERGDAIPEESQSNKIEFDFDLPEPTANLLQVHSQPRQSEGSRKGSIKGGGVGGADGGWSDQMPDIDFDFEGSAGGAQERGGTIEEINMQAEQEEEKKEESKEQQKEMTIGGGWDDDEDILDI